VRKKYCRVESWRPAEHDALAVAEVPTPPTAVVAARNPDTTTRRVPSVLSKRQLRAVLAIYLPPRPCHSVAIRHRSLLSRSNCPISFVLLTILLAWRGVSSTLLFGGHCYACYCMHFNKLDFCTRASNLSILEIVDVN